MGNNGYIAVSGCKKCGKCDNVCPALYKINGEAIIDYTECDRCRKCTEICPNKALVYLD